MNFILLARKSSLGTPTTCSCDQVWKLSSTLAGFIDSWAGTALFSPTAVGSRSFHLAKLRRITEDGVHFNNHIDGSPCFLSPEISMEIQAALGLMSQWPSTSAHLIPVSWNMLLLAWNEHYVGHSVAEPGPPNGRMKIDRVFGIVQGAVYGDLREKSARSLVEMDFDGYAVGGVSVGEPEPEMMRAIENTEPFLPAERPRYAMGLGTPPQIVEMVARGIDMFDCVLPTRLARNGTAFTRFGTVNLKNNPYRLDERPIEEECACATCRTFARGYIRHLIKAEEILGLRLITMHNLYFYLNLTQQIRDSIENGTFPQFRERFVSDYVEHKHA